MLTATLSVSVAFAGGKTLKAYLSGNDEVPGVQTKAEGEAKLILSNAGKDYSRTSAT